MYNSKAPAPSPTYVVVVATCCFQMHVYNDQIINGAVSPDLVAMFLEGARSMGQQSAPIVNLWKMVGSWLLMLQITLKC